MKHIPSIPLILLALLRLWMTMMTVLTINDTQTITIRTTATTRPPDSVEGEFDLDSTLMRCEMKQEIGRAHV